MSKTVLSNETVLMEQYVNDRGSGWGSEGLCPPAAETRLAFGRSMEATKWPAFQYLEMQKITDICSLHDPRSFLLTFP